MPLNHHWSYLRHILPLWAQKKKDFEMSQVTLVQQSHGEGQLQGLLQQQQQRIEAVRQRSRNNNHLLVQVGQHLLDGGF
jgi:flagellar hook-length control protein FliK